jgi:hypothetical protein
MIGCDPDPRRPTMLAKDQKESQQKIQFIRKRAGFLRASTWVEDEEMNATGR